MAMRWGLGPVFIYESLITARRWQTYAMRSIAVSTLLVAMATIAWSNVTAQPASSMGEYAQLGKSYFYAMIGVALSLVMLAAPAATASAISADRVRGTLVHLLATELSDWEIVLGKLASRLLPVLFLVACTWPVLAITSLLGGIDPVALTIAFAVIVAVAVFGCSLTLLLSVWARKPHEAVLVTYTFWLFVMLISTIWTGLSMTGLVGPPSGWADVANPFYLALVPYAASGPVNFWQYLSFFTVTLVGSGIFTALAVWRMRPVTCRSIGENRKAGLARLGRLSRWLPGPSLDGNPVLWRELRRSRPSGWMVALFLLVGGSTSVACGVGAFAAWKYGIIPFVSPRPAVLAGIFGAVIQVFFGFLMLSAVAPISMSEEQERGSLELLAATPLPTRMIVLGKWWGIFRMVPWLTIGPGLMAAALAGADQPPPPPGMPGTMTLTPPQLTPNDRLFGAALAIATILAHGAAATSIGLALVIWIKRQSRAVAVSVGLFVLTAVGWPFLVLVVAGRGPDHDAFGLAAMSPVFYTAFSGFLLAARMEQFRLVFPWATFWVFEMTLVAGSALWLAIRTFDRSFGRIPDRTQHSAVLPWVVTIALTGVAVMFANWGFDFVQKTNPNTEEAAKIVTLVLVAMFELLVLSLAIAIVESFGRRQRPPGKLARIER
jgi:ABC-type transport system involved in multi-copper enzyme maturation permease subunit